jgi:hypothetical protein
MLSDSLRQMREAFLTGAYKLDTAGLVLILRAYEAEARNMEDRLELLTGTQHVPLDGLLVSKPSPIIDLRPQGY